MVARWTIYEVASRSGVSTATVSRVMDNGTGYSPATRERVLGVARELGWVPSASARSLASRRTGIVGLLLPDFANAGETEEESSLYVDQVIRGAERAASAAGDAVLIAATGGSSGRELAFSVAGKVDGLVVMARSLSESDIESIARSVPVVVLATRSARSREFDRIRADNRGGARTIVTHLIAQHACRDLVFIGGPARSPDSMERFAGFREALGDAGLPAPSAPYGRGGFTKTGGARAVQELLAKRRLPHAIVCGNDEMAIGALAVLNAAKVKIRATSGSPDSATPRPRVTCGHHSPRCVSRCTTSATRPCEPCLPDSTIAAPTGRRSCCPRNRCCAAVVAAAPAQPQRADWEQRIYRRLTDTTSADASAALPAPQNVRALPGSGHVRLSWDAVDGAAGYLIERTGRDGDAHLLQHGGSDVPAVPSSPSLQRANGFTALLISHDLGVVLEATDRVWP